MPTTGSDTQPMSTPYHNLAHKPRIRLERRFAIRALERFGFPLTPLRLLTLSHSARFRVVAEQSYLLRLQSPAWHPFAALASELSWLMTLRQRTTPHVPEPLRAPDGQVLVELTLPDTTQDVYANAVDPGWVLTKMGGPNAPDDLQQGYETQTWLAVSNDSRATVSGRYFHHLTERRSNPQASDAILQEKFLSLCQDITGISFPLEIQLERRAKND